MLVLDGRCLEYPAVVSVDSRRRNAMHRTLRRYSTARSGLKKAARMAASMSARAKPMLSMFATAASRSLPMVRAEGSLKLGPEACVAGAGEGVAGAFCVVAEDCAGAGAEGVWAAAGAGVDGTALLDDAAEGFGYRGLLAARVLIVLSGSSYLGDHAHDEALLFDIVRLYRVRILENLACCAGSAAGRECVTLHNAGEATHQSK